MPHTIIGKEDIHSPVHVNFHLKESPALYLTHTVRQFAISLLGIFIPMYIFTLTLKPALTEKILINSVMWVLIYYFIHSSSVVLFSSWMTNKMFNRLTLKWSIFLSTLVLSMMLLLLALTTKYFWLIIPAAVFSGLQTYLYWIPYHIFFVQKSNTNHGSYGGNLGTRVFLSKIARAAGPILGGLIITIYGFDTLFFLGILILAISSIPILASVEEHKHGKHNTVQIFKKYIHDKSLRNKTIAITAEGVESMLYSILWPVLMFVALASFSKVGMITSISILISSLAAILVGKIIDRKDPRSIHKMGVTVNSLLYLSRALVMSPMAFYMIDVVDRINGVFHSIPFFSEFYKQAAKEKPSSDFIIYRSTLKWAAVSIALLLIIIILPLLPDWRIIFIIIAIIAPFSYLIRK